MNILQSATATFLSLGAFIQSLIIPTQPVDLLVPRKIESPLPTPVEVIEIRDDSLLPDMKVFPPKELYIRNNGGVKTMHFNTTFVNIGEGSLEMIGENDSERGVTVATQRIQMKDGSFEEKVIGEFVLHPTHGHWHVDRYAQFQIYSRSTMSDMMELVAETDKFSFCIWDEHTYDLTLPGAPQTRQFPRCPKNIQGNSVGWGDTYTADTAGQEIDITDVPDGSYTVRSVVNADNKILENNYFNNEALLNIEIIGKSVRIIEN